MAISESEGGAKTGSPVQGQQAMHEELANSSLNKQSSIFSLTLDEIQLKSGKTFGSMNMGEFLSNLWNVEENQAPLQLNQNELVHDKGIESQPTIARQGCFSIPTPLCKKTVDEVWFKIQKDLPQQFKDNNIADHEPPQRQGTLGEMTLEDFLIKAGVVQEPSGSSQQKKVATPVQTNGAIMDANYGMGHVMGTSEQIMLAPIQNNNASLDANYGMGHVMGLGFPGHQIVPNNMVAAGNGYAAAYPIFTQPKAIMGEPSNGSENGNDSNSLLEPAVLQNKKRIIDGPPKVVVERRQCRMIKNRESAARSQARKQYLFNFGHLPFALFNSLQLRAYAVELELELDQLKHGNAKLKQIVEENKQRRKQEALERMQQSTHEQRKVDKKETLRTVSLGW